MMSDLNWRKKNDTILSRLKYVLLQDKFTDAIFVVQGKEFKAHKLILALGSPYFERTYYHTFQYQGMLPIVVSDVSPDGFQCMLNFLYTDKVTFGCELQAFSTYVAANKFEIDDLKTRCEIFLSDLDLSPKTVWTRLENATQQCMENIVRKCTTYLQNNTSACFADKTFLTASNRVMLKLVQFDKLAATEIELLENLVLWAKNKNRNNDEGELKTFLLPYLYNIRFKALSATQFCSFVEKYPKLFNPSDKAQILRYLERPYSEKLPGWCCQLFRRMWL